MDIAVFKKTIWDFYSLHKRDFPWRSTWNPYHIFVSEVMLQQTQTYRVLPKYMSFIEQFTDFAALAHSAQVDLLKAWQGLGYNRRALFLQRAANIIHTQYAGNMPQEPSVLVELPGIGKATAASIAAFAFNKPTIFIETNIRAVYIHHFFPDKDKVTDNELLPYIIETVDQDNPREWYYALMDYGVFLKAQLKNPARKSAHYAKQSSFEGSDRQIRGLIIKILTDVRIIEREFLIEQICTLLPHTDGLRANRIINGLIQEQFFKIVDDTLFL